jgi:hypothetical protein
MDMTPHTTPATREEREMTIHECIELVCEYHVQDIDTGICVECGEDWQCPTSRVADELLNASARLAAAERERDAMKHAADRFLSCLGEFDGDGSYCSEYADVLESLVIAATPAGTERDALGAAGSPAASLNVED